MKKIVSNILIVSAQLLVGGLFLLTLFSNNDADNSVVVVRNNNLDKMADSVSELFVESLTQTKEVNDSTVEEIRTAEEAEKERARIEAEEKAKAEAEAQAKAQAEAERKQEEERKAQEEAARQAVVVNANGYISKPGSGFNVTTGNTTYSLSGSDFVAVSAVINCEGTSKDDMLAVASVILNRADARGQTPLQVVSAAGQFTCYTMYVNGSASSSGGSDQVLTDALNGIRNNNYHSFNGMYSGVSDNYIVSNGNRFY